MAKNIAMWDCDICGKRHEVRPGNQIFIDHKRLSDNKKKAGRTENLSQKDFERKREDIYNPERTIIRSGRAAVDNYSAGVNGTMSKKDIARVYKNWRRSTSGANMSVGIEALDKRERLLDSTEKILKKNKDNKVYRAKCKNGFAIDTAHGGSIEVGDHEVLHVINSNGEFIVDPATAAPFANAVDGDLGEYFGSGMCKSADGLSISHVYEYTAAGSVNYDSIITEAPGEDGESQEIWTGGGVHIAGDADGTRELALSYGENLKKMYPEDIADFRVSPSSETIVEEKEAERIPNEAEAQPNKKREEKMKREGRTKGSRKRTQTSNSDNKSNRGRNNGSDRERDKRGGVFAPSPKKSNDDGVDVFEVIDQAIDMTMGKFAPKEMNQNLEMSSPVQFEKTPKDENHSENKKTSRSNREEAPRRKRTRSAGSEERKRANSGRKRKKTVRAVPSEPPLRED